MVAPLLYSLRQSEAGDKQMYENYTDTENTGAPLVPMVEENDDIATDGGREAAHEEVVLSHRLRD